MLIKTKTTLLTRWAAQAQSHPRKWHQVSKRNQTGLHIMLCSAIHGHISILKCSGQWTMGQWVMISGTPGWMRMDAASAYTGCSPNSADLSVMDLPIGDGFRTGPQAPATAQALLVDPQTHSCFDARAGTCHACRIACCVVPFGLIARAVSHDSMLSSAAERHGYA